MLSVQSRNASMTLINSIERRTEGDQDIIDPTAGSDLSVTTSASPTTLPSNIGSLGY